MPCTSLMVARRSLSNCRASLASAGTTSPILASHSAATSAFCAPVEVWHRGRGGRKMNMVELIYTRKVR